MKFAIYYLVEYGIVAAIALPLMCYAMLRARAESAWRPIMLASSWLAIVVAAWMILCTLPAVTHDGWSQSRLAPAIAWMNGDRLYYGERNGPVLVRMYGPGSAMVYAPTALASRPTPALLIGAAINLAFFVAPAIWFIRRASRAIGVGDAAHAVAPAALFFGVAILGSKLLETATTVTIDAPAIGLMVCACAVLVGGDAAISFRRALVCGLFAALSAWSKQTMAPAVIALSAYTLLVDRTSRGAGRALAIVGAFIVASVAIVLAFGPREIVFDMFVVPSRHPWQWPWLDRFESLARGARTIWRESAAGATMLLAFIALGARRSERASRISVLQQPWILPTLVALLVVPTSAAAIAKIGGRANNAAPTSYFIILAVAAALVAALARTRSSLALDWRARMIRLAFVALMIGLSVATLLREWRESGWRRMRDWSRMSSNPVERAFEVAGAHPGEYYFPQYPLASVMAEGRAYHAEAGIDDLIFARVRISPERLRAALPPRMSTIAYYGAPGGPMPALLPDFSRRAAAPPELGAGWTILRNKD